MLPEREHLLRNRLALTLMNFRLVQYINLWKREEGGWGLWVMRTSAFVLLQSKSNICLHVYKWEIQLRHVSFHVPHVHSSLPGRGPPLEADFCNSYLDEWLKLRHSRQESHHSYLRKNGMAVIFWCIACHPACKRDRLIQRCLSAPPSLPSSPTGPQRVALGDWSGAVASLETCGKSAHPASAEKTLRHADLMWSGR